MPVYKDEKRNSWRVIYRATDYQGIEKQRQKRGFSTKRDALAWEREQMLVEHGCLDMTFEDFVEQIYTADMKNRIKQSTWKMKEGNGQTKSSS